MSRKTKICSLHRFSLLALVGLASCAPAGPDRTQTHFEKWKKIGDVRVYDRARIAPDGSQTADRIHMSAGEGLYYQPAQVIKAGDTVEFSLTIWGRGQSDLALQIYNFCSAKAPEIADLKIKVTETPTRHKLSHQFKDDQACVRTQIIMNSVDSFVQAWKPEYKLIKSVAPPPTEIPLLDPEALGDNKTDAQSSSSLSSESADQSSKTGAVSPVPDLSGSGIVTPLRSH